jgi:hypothetical protein
MDGYCLRSHGVALSRRDLEKAEKIKEVEQIHSRSELVRRLIDAEYRRIANGTG